MAPIYVPSSIVQLLYENRAEKLKRLGVGKLKRLGVGKLKRLGIGRPRASTRL